MKRQKEESFIGYFLVIGLMLALSPTTLNTAFATPPSGTSWTLTWSDEFSGTSIDADKWSWGQLPWGGYDQGGYYASYTTAEDSYLSNGSLILRSRKGDFGGQPWSQGFVFGHEWAYYGYVEIRANHTKGEGIWVGLWMLHYGWPPEFDIAEYYGTDDLMRMGLCYKFGGTNKWDRVFVGPEDWENWHTYGMEWGPGFAKFYMDDALEHSIEVAQVPNVPMYTILQSGMDDTYDETTPNPNYYEVDYIRWYKDDELPAYHPDFLPRMIDCTHDDVTYSGTWYSWTGNPVWMGNEYYSNETDAVAEFSFTGTKVAWWSAKRNDLGKADILLDDELVATIDCYKPGGAQYHQNLYESPELDYGAHTLGVRVTGTKAKQSQGVEILIDAFRYAYTSSSYCGDETCDGNEDQCNCPDDCGTPPSTETSCTDEIDNDCDTYIDCDDHSDCDSDPACQGSCTATDMHIEAVVCAEVDCGQGKKNGQATVTIYDDCGDPVVNALVDGTFTGDFSESFYDVQTDQYGDAVFTTSGCIRKPSFTFTVTDVTDSLPYDSGDNVTDNCSG